MISYTCGRTSGSTGKINNNPTTVSTSGSSSIKDYLDDAKYVANFTYKYGIKPTINTLTYEIEHLKDDKGSNTQGYGTNNTVGSGVGGSSSTSYSCGSISQSGGYSTSEFISDFAHIGYEYGIKPTIKYAEKEISRQWNRLTSPNNNSQGLNNNISQVSNSNIISTSGRTGYSQNNFGLSNSQGASGLQYSSGYKR